MMAVSVMVFVVVLAVAPAFVGLFDIDFKDRRGAADFIADDQQRLTVRAVAGGYEGQALGPEITHFRIRGLVR